MTQIEIQDLTFTYPAGGAPALDRVSLSVEQGEFVTLCGLSGCGKSTLLRLMKPGLFPQGKRSGRVLFSGVELTHEPDRDTAARIGFVMQDPDSQTVTDKVWHELAFSCESVGMPQGEIRRRVAEMAGYFGLEELFRRDTETLSGGQKQLLCLASAAALHPEVLLLDEPTSQLDPIAAQVFIDAVRRLNRDFGMTVIAAEHRLEELLPISDRVVVMDEGAVLADCPPALLAERLPEGHPMERALTAAQRVFRLAGGTGKSPVSVREGRSDPLCREYLSNHPEVCGNARSSPARDGEPLIAVSGLYAGWKGSAPEVLTGLSLKLYSGEVYALIGGNGSGKSTLLKAITGILKPLGGRVKLRRGLKTAYLPQNPCMLFTRESVGEEAPAEYLARFGLSGLADRDPLDLSGGERQRLALAKLLSGKPDVLLLDEPTKGMDAAAKREFAAMLRELAAEGISTLLVTHDTGLAEECADICALLFDGEIVNEATPAEMFSGNYFYTTPMSRLARGIIS
ncbi:MAG: ABC transporter ATP-binding protein [Oscillospiraceae bacterium]